MTTEQIKKVFDNPFFREEFTELPNDTVWEVRIWLIDQFDCGNIPLPDHTVFAAKKPNIDRIKQAKANIRISYKYYEDLMITVRIGKNEIRSISPVDASANFHFRGKTTCKENIAKLPVGIKFVNNEKPFFLPQNWEFSAKFYIPDTFFEVAGVREHFENVVVEKVLRLEAENAFAGQINDYIEAERSKLSI